MEENPEGRMNVDGRRRKNKSGRKRKGRRIGWMIPRKEGGRKEEKVEG